MTPGKLHETATSMRLALTGVHVGHRHQPLPRGLHLVLQRTNHRWRLALAREAVYPSDTEIEICKKAFNVPEGSEENRAQRPGHHPTSKRPLNFCVVEFFWSEVTKPELWH